MKDFEIKVQEASIPDQLKKYLVNSKTASDIVTNEMLNDIEELFILYSSLYFFDTTEFSLNTILVLKKAPALDTIYHYLKKVIDTNVFLISKGDEDNYTLLENEVIDEVIEGSIANFSKLLEGEKDDINENLAEVYKGIGKLQLLTQITNDETCKNLYNTATTIIQDCKFDLPTKN